MKNENDLIRLCDCFEFHRHLDIDLPTDFTSFTVFTKWLSITNHKFFYKKSTRILYGDNAEGVRDEIKLVTLNTLSDILDILLREPLADYFWFNHHGELTYLPPSTEIRPVPGDSLNLKRDKIKRFIRDIKINKIIEQ
jgi:hypothetical protein